MLRSVIIKTSSGEINTEADDSLTLEGFLRTKRIPPNLFQAYKNIEQESIEPIPLDTFIFKIPDDNKIILQCIRNIDLKDVLPQKTQFEKVSNPIISIPEFNFGENGCSQIIHELNQDSAKELVKEKILNFTRITCESKTIVVGISGGGDSNTLAQGLKEFSIKYLEKKFVFFTIVFEPIWPKSAAERASELCKKYSLNHLVYGNKEVEDLLGMKGSLDDFYKEYIDKFGNNTSHFFGTYLISIVARKLCKKYDSTEYILGFNREDILSDLIFSLMNGQKPLSFPIRNFGNIRLLMPLWDIPKIVLDACYPNYSLSNYNERRGEQSTYQRNIIYYLAHGIEDMYPNLGLSIMQGVQKIFDNKWPELKIENGYDIFPSEYANPEKIREVKELLKKYFD